MIFFLLIRNILTVKHGRNFETLTFFREETDLSRTLLCWILNTYSFKRKENYSEYISEFYYFQMHILIAEKVFIKF